MPDRDPLAEIQVRGVGRVAEEPRALLVLLTERPTDDELRSLHEFLRGWSGAAHNNSIDPAGLNRARSEAMRRGDVAFERADAIVRAYLGLAR